MDKYLDIAKELKKAVGHQSEGETNYSWCYWRSEKESRP